MEEILEDYISTADLKVFFNLPYFIKRFGMYAFSIGGKPNFHFHIISF